MILLSFRSVFFEAKKERKPMAAITPEKSASLSELLVPPYT